MKTKLEDLKGLYVEHRLELSEDLKHSILMENVLQIKEWKEQIKELDEIIKVLFK